MWALLRRQSETDDRAWNNAKREYFLLRQNVLLIEQKPAIPPSKRAWKEVIGESNQRWCADGFKFNFDNGEHYAQRSHDREALHRVASTGGYDSETVQYVMPGAVEHRFGSSLPTSFVEWLSYNGSA